MHPVIEDFFRADPHYNYGTISSRKVECNMKRSQLAKGLFIALCAVMLSGCQTSSPGKDRRPETDSATSQSQQSPDTGSDIDSLAASALAHGDVVEFTESGCIISPVQDDGDTSIIAAPEHMDETEKITIQYQEGCEVQIAVSDASTGETDFRPASLSDIKKADLHSCLWRESGFRDY